MDIPLTVESKAHLLQHLDVMNIADPDRERYRTVVRNEIADIDASAGGMVYADHLRDRLVAATGRGSPSQRADVQAALDYIDEIIAEPDANPMTALHAIFEDGLTAGSAPRGG